METLGRRGSTPEKSGDAATVCVVPDDDGGGGVNTCSGHYEVEGLSPSAGYCRWSTGSPARSSYHSPAPPGPHHHLTDRQTKKHKMDHISEGMCIYIHFLCVNFMRLYVSKAKNVSDNYGSRIIHCF